MNNLAIRIENLGKQYKIGARRETGALRYKSLRESLAAAASLPLRKARSLLRRADCKNGGPPKTFWALKDVSFEIKRGEAVGVIGGNGAGKSTLLKTLSRITEPTCGRIEMRGRVGALLEVGTGFHPELTGRENIYLNGAILGMPRAAIDRQFDEIVSFAEIEKFIETPVKHYSSGMYLRLAFAVAAHLEPDILLVDEVLAVGDASFQKKCLGKMGQIASHGRTVLFVSHSMATVGALCESAILLNNGKVASVGPVARVIDEYLASLHHASASYKSRTQAQSGIGDGSPRVVDAAILGADGRPCSRFAHGADICFAFSLVMSPPQPAPRCVILVRTSTAVPVLHLTSNHHLDWQFLNRKGKTSVYCVMPKCSLYPGDYLCSIWIGNGHQAVHFLQDALAFRVELGGDLLAAGFDISWNNGLYHCATEWRTSRECLSEALEPAQ